MWDEAKKYFAPGSKRHPEVGTAAKDLALAEVNLGEFLTSKYSLWLDLRTSDDDRLHGSGRRIENASEGITIQITKKAEAAGALNIYLFVVMDAQLNIEDSRFVSAAYCGLTGGFLLLQCCYFCESSCMFYLSFNFNFYVSRIMHL